MAAEYAPEAAAGGAGRDAGAGGREVRGGGTAAGPIPGPIALVSCLENRGLSSKCNESRRKRQLTGQDLSPYESQRFVRRN